MLVKSAFTAFAFASVVAIAVGGLASAAPERVEPQSFGQRVASGAASLMMKGIAAGYESQTPAPETAGGPVIVRVDFTAVGDLDQFSDRMDGFAPFLSNTPGLVWKVWALDRETRNASGTYLFETRHQADMYLSEILPEGMGNVPYISNTRIEVTPVMINPSRVTHAVFMSADNG